MSLCITAWVAGVHRSIKRFVFTANGPAITHTLFKHSSEYDVALRNPTDAEESLITTDGACVCECVDRNKVGCGLV